MDSVLFARNWQDRFPKEILSWRERISAADHPETSAGDHQGTGHSVRDREIFFCRIFFRNSINNGLLLIEQPDLHDDIKEGDEVTVVMNEHVDYNGKTYRLLPCLRI